MSIRYFRRQTLRPMGEGSCQPREIPRDGMRCWIGSRHPDPARLLDELDAEARAHGKSSIFKTPVAEYWAEADKPEPEKEQTPEPASAGNAETKVD